MIYICIQHKSNKQAFCSDKYNMCSGTQTHDAMASSMSIAVHTYQTRIGKKTSGELNAGKECNLRWICSVDIRISVIELPVYRLYTFMRGTSSPPDNTICQQTLPDKYCIPSPIRGSLFAAPHTRRFCSQSFLK